MNIVHPEGGWKDFFCRWKTGERDKNILQAFRATEQAVRLLLAKYEKAGMTLVQAAELADYIRAQHDLMEQVLKNRQPRRARLFGKKRQRLRRQLLTLSRQCGLDTEIIEGRCRTWSGSAGLH